MENRRPRYNLSGLWGFLSKTGMKLGKGQPDTKIKLHMLFGLFFTCIHLNLVYKVHPLYNSCQINQF